MGLMAQLYAICVLYFWLISKAALAVDVINLDSNTIILTQNEDGPVENLELVRI